MARAGRLDEPVEDRQRVERTRAAFGVVLHRFDRQRSVAQPLHRSVVQVDLADHEAARRRQRVGNDGDLVVLGGDLDQTSLEVLHGVVRGVVAERKSPRPRSGRAADDLVAQAYAEERAPVRYHLPRQGHRAVKSGGVAGARREDDAVDV